MPTDFDVLLRDFLRGELDDVATSLLVDSLRRADRFSWLHQSQLDAARQAVLGKRSADSLSEQEMRLFMELFGLYMSGTNAEGRELATALLKEDGNVGDDDRGRLVQTRNGKLEPLGG